MKERLKQFQTDVKALNEKKINEAADFNKWTSDYAAYVVKGGDRPPHKPPTPLK